MSAALAKYSADQTRDERGRWTSGAGGGAATPQPTPPLLTPVASRSRSTTQLERSAVGSASAPSEIDEYVPYEKLPQNAKKILEHRILLPDGTIGVGHPDGYVATPSRTGEGIIYREPGSVGNANTIRIMPPNEQYPSGRVIIYNGQGQPISPYSGRTGSRGQYHYHYRGTVPVPEP